MLSNEMADLIKQRDRKGKKKKSHIPYRVGLILITLILFVIFLQKQYTYAVCSILGIGIVLRYLQFSFSEAFSDPFLVVFLIGTVLGAKDYSFLVQSYY